MEAERAKSTSAKLQTTLKETNESVKKQASIIIDKAKNITKKEVPPEVRPEEMKFVQSKRHFVPHISEWDFF